MRHALYGIIVLLALVYLAVTGHIKDGTWGQKALLALDILVSTLVWGDFDITISSRCGLYLREPRGPLLWRGLGRVLNSIAKGHCEFAIAHDLLRAQLATATLNPAAFAVQALSAHAKAP